MITVASSNASESTRAGVIKSFLAKHSLEISLEQAATLDDMIGPVDDGNHKPLAKLARAKLLEIGLEVNHSRALQLIARLAGHRSHEVWVSKGSAHRPSYIVSLTVEEKALSARQYARIGSAVKELFNLVAKLMPEPAEPAVCFFSRSPQGFALDFRPSVSPYFEVKFDCVVAQEGSKSPIPTALEVEDLRKTCERVVENLTRMNPAMLIAGGFMPEGPEPWYQARFRVVFNNSSRATFEHIDEVAVFKLFYENECDELLPTAGRIVIRHRKGNLRVEPEWLSFEAQEARPEAAAQIEEVGRLLWSRYLNYWYSTGNVSAMLANISGQAVASTQGAVIKEAAEAKEKPLAQTAAKQEKRLVKRPERFTPPSWTWHKQQAKRLHKAIGRETLKLGQVQIILAVAYGWESAFQLMKTLESGTAPKPVWDFELDETQMGLRRRKQLSVLAEALNLTEDGAAALLNAGWYSNPRHPPSAASVTRVEAESTGGVLQASESTVGATDSSGDGAMAADKGLIQANESHFAADGEQGKPALSSPGAKVAYRKHRIVVKPE